MYITRMCEICSIQNTVDHYRLVPVYCIGNYMYGIYMYGIYIHVLHMPASIIMLMRQLD